MPEPEPTKPRELGRAVVGLAGALARLPPGPLAELRRASPGAGVAAFWRVYFACGLDAQPGRPEDWEWVAAALALMTPTGDDPDKRNAHDGAAPLGATLFAANVSEPRVAKILNNPLSQRRDALMRLARLLARTGKGVDTVDLARLLLFADAERARLHRLAQSYYAAEHAATKEVSDA
jgi:CRISPR system Cascade subunit CasB